MHTIVGRLTSLRPRPGTIHHRGLPLLDRARAAVPSGEPPRRVTSGLWQFKGFDYVGFMPALAFFTVVSGTSKMTQYLGHAQLIDMWCRGGIQRVNISGIHHMPILYATVCGVRVRVGLHARGGPERGGIVHTRGRGHQPPAALLLSRPGAGRGAVRAWDAVQPR